MVYITTELTKSDVVEFINATLRQWNNGITKIETDPYSGKTIITRSDQNKFLLFTPELANFLGFDVHTIRELGDQFQYWDETKRDGYVKDNVRKSSSFEYEPADYQIVNDKSKTYCFSERKWLIHEFKRIFIHSDCIKPHFTGHLYSSILSIVPNKSDSYFHFERPCFYPIYGNRLSKITVHLTDENGNKVETSGRVILILEIKRQKI